jgi:hypothetical protein
MEIKSFPQHFMGVTLGNSRFGNNVVPEKNIWKLDEIIRK